MFKRLFAKTDLDSPADAPNPEQFANKRQLKSNTKDVCQLITQTKT